MKKIALEEAVTAPGLETYLNKTLELITDPIKRDGLTAALEDRSNQRIVAMDEAGVDIFVLSHTSPGVQVEADAGLAAERARMANDYLNAQVQMHPQRYRAFAHVALQDVAAAGTELERCVNDLGFVGVLINGNTNGVYLDDERYFPFWDAVTGLDVPVYIHPADPLVQPAVLDGYPEMTGAVWGWSLDNSTHFLRLILSGLFDRFPSLRVVLGHMGETLPYFAWRIDKRFADMENARKLAKRPSDYFRSNLYITTSGCCQDSSLLCALAELGDDRVLFSVDYPYENSKEAVDWIDRAPLSDEQREKICHLNAEHLMRL